MKTLKKTLCLVLAVVMVVGALVLPASAKDYGDIESVGKDYKTAVTTLQTWRIMEGDNAGNFKPEASIQRQEMAAIVYRVMTGDIKDADGKDNSAIYAPYATAKFADVKATDWAAGYIGYCANKGIVLGTNDAQTTFEPTRAIPANDVLAMLLRCLGYTQKDEFTGANWADKVGALATRLGLTEKITRALNEASQRQEVAQMTYKAAAAASRVTWSDSEQDYIPYVDPNDPGSKANDKLVVQSGGDTSTSSKRDQWGGVGDTTTNATKVTFYYPVPSVSKEVVAASSASSAKATYTTAVSQCDLAAKLGEKKTFHADVYTNGIENKTTTTIDPLNTTAQIGAQGRQTLVYKNPKFDSTKDDSAANPSYIIVYKDTLLAKVTNVTKSTKDAQDHIKTKAALTLTVYVGYVGSKGSVTSSTAAADNSAVVSVTLSSDTDYTYAKGDYVLVNYHQNNTLAADNKSSVNNNGIGIRKDSDWATKQKYVDQDTAFVEGTVTAKIGDKKYVGDWNKDGEFDVNDFVTVIDKAGSFTGAQTKVTYNGNSHTIADVEHLDNNRYVLDDAGTTMKTSFTWLTDKKDNVIGSVKDAAANSYGVITRIWAAIDNSDGTTTVKANVTYMDGTTKTVEVHNMTYYTGAEATKITSAVVNNLLYGVATYTDGKNTPMTASDNKFYVSDSYNTNWAADKDDAKGEGIILDHLFKITASTDADYAGAFDFVEVAGNGAKTGCYKNDTLNIDVNGLGNDTTEITTGKAKNGDVQVDNDTVFLICTGDEETNTYTFESVPGYKNVDSYVSGEVDYVDCDDDDAAEYVYIFAGKKGAEGWHLFFADSKTTSDKTNENKPLVKVDDNGKTYTVYGYLDGVYSSVTIKQSETNLIKTFGKDMKGNTLWMVYIENGYVTDVNGAAANGTTGDKPVNDPANASTFASGVAFNTTNGMGNVDSDLLGDYANQSIMVVTVGDQDDYSMNTNGTITLGTKAFTKVDPTYGDWNDLVNAGKDIPGSKDGKFEYTVIVVYNTKTETITQAYIFSSKDDGTSYTGGDPVTTPTTTFPEPTNKVGVRISEHPSWKPGYKGYVIVYAVTGDAGIQDVVKAINAQLAVSLPDYKFKAADFEIGVIEDQYKLVLIDNEDVTVNVNLYGSFNPVYVNGELTGAIGNPDDEVSVDDLLKDAGVTPASGEKIWMLDGTEFKDVTAGTNVTGGKAIQLYVCKDITAVTLPSGSVAGTAVANKAASSFTNIQPTTDNVETVVESTVKDLIKNKALDASNVDTDTVDSIVNSVVDALKSKGVDFQTEYADVVDSTNKNNKGLQRSVLSDVVTGLVKGVSGADAAATAKAKVKAAKAYVDWFFENVNTKDAEAKYGFDFENVTLSSSNGYTVTITGTPTANHNGLAAVTQALKDAGLKLDWTAKNTSEGAKSTDITLDNTTTLNFGNAISTLSKKVGAAAGSKKSASLTLKVMNGETPINTITVNYVFDIPKA